jgi:pyrroloquinoline quinone biosynthesis protein D
MSRFYVRQRDMTHVTPRQPGESDFAGNPPSAPASKRVGRSQGMKGKTASLRRTIRLAAGYQLRMGPAGNEPRLLSPKGSIQVNETAATILELCNGKRTAEEIVAHVLSTRDDSLANDVRAFLDAAQRRGWIVKR